MQMLFGESAEPMSGLNPDAMDKERSGIVCRTMNAAKSPIVSGIKLFERDGKRGEMVLGRSRWSVDDMRNNLLITY